MRSSIVFLLLRRESAVLTTDEADEPSGSWSLPTEFSRIEWGTSTRAEAGGRGSSEVCGEDRDADREPEREPSHCNYDTLIIDNA